MTPDEPKQTHFGFRTVAEKDKAGLVHGVFSRVASRYDVMNDLMSVGVHRVWKTAMMDWLAPRDGQHLLDVAGGTGDVDLYTRLNAAPTASAYDCESVLAGNNEVCGTATPQPGTYYILLSGYSTYSGVTLRVTYRQPSAKVTLNVAKAGTGQGTVVSTSSVSAQLPTADTTSTPKIVGGEPAQFDTRRPVA